MALKRILGFFTSLRLTVACLALATVLVFIGTIAQVDVGIYAAQAKYFRSLFVFWDVPGTSLRIPVFPGGYLIGGTLLISLLISLVTRIGLRKEKAGLALVHVGLILLLLGQLGTDLFSEESSMRLREGETKFYSEDLRHSELVIMDTTNPAYDEVVAVPESVLARRQVIPAGGLPLTVKVLHYWRNSSPVPPTQATGASLATEGLGKQQRFVEAPLEPRLDRRNVPTAYVELLAEGKSLGIWVVSGWIDELQPFTYKDRTYALGIRLKRYYKPFTVGLLDFRHDKYAGTDIPKNFSSRVRVQRPETGEDREVLIYMNNPLRYGGETFYQSGYDERDPRIRVTILQVVRNPGWLTPYLGCVLVGLGLCVQFLSHLLPFLKKRTA